MKIAEIINHLETIAPPVLQEDYDNAGLITGNAAWNCTGILCTLDATEAVVEEAKTVSCNLIVAHHPIVFRGLKKINGKNYVEQTIINAIKNDIAIYAIHTNLDNVITGVNNKIADKLGLKNRQVLLPKENMLKKLCTFVPLEHAENVRSALFSAGAGSIGNYSECSFNAAGKGTFRAGENTHPFVGEQNLRHTEDEVKIEVVFPFYLEQKILAALLRAHPYEEVAYDIILLSNQYNNIGSGLIGELEAEKPEADFLAAIKGAFGLSVIKHTPLLQKPVKKVAVCGGAGSFLIHKAKAAGADFYITSDIKYHEFFDADGKLVIADIGHWESEQFTTELLYDILQAKFPNFAVLKTKMDTNPVKYFTGHWNIKY
ncbi:Nif3-like dinuclear metal center hexameric protein [Parafilimonas sp.]|uniref:Nif3-like dinuclear metal center hexameric protein n=1 Tax=Parafilimonas sp. TaxID=1969739 RepID=UPI0039E63575